MISFDPTKESVARVHGLLLSSVAPRPIGFVSTMDAMGNPNLSPFSFFNCFSAKPPILIFSPARRVRDNTIKHTLENVREVSEVVINVVNYSMVQQTSLASVEYAKGVNEFIKSGFTPVPSERVKPFRVKESPVQLECKVNQIIELGTEGGAGNLVICEVLLIHVDENVMIDDKIDPHKMDLVARMGADYYCRASGKSIFEVAKPNTKIGIGIDSLPKEIRESNILSGNDLGQLGNVESIPETASVKLYFERHAELKSIYTTQSPDTFQNSVHALAHQLLLERKVEEAWLTLLSLNV